MAQPAGTPERYEFDLSAALQREYELDELLAALHAADDAALERVAAAHAGQAVALVCHGGVAVPTRAGKASSWVTDAHWQ